PILHGLFIIVQVSFLFHYSKVFIQDFPSLSRFGVMHVVATNLSIWTATIIDENVPTYHAYSGLRARTPFTYTNENSKTRGSILCTRNCTCDQEFCKTISVAESFLFPFLIEFSLVACCLLYVTWKNVGKDPPACQHIVKPSYKLYRSYRGTPAIRGDLAKVTFIHSFILWQDVRQQVVAILKHNVTIQSLMTLACVCGFYLFWKTSHEQKQEGEDLDAALLLICLVGPILVETFSVLAIIVGDDNKIYGWIMSLGYPISDSIQCVGQVIFILYGLKREPLNTIETKETATRSDEQDETSTSRQRKNTLASLPPKSLAKSVKIVAETKIPDPNKTRLMLRDIIMFLLIANACLWMFWSLEGTAFVIYTYPYVYYGHSAWTTIAMVCKPLLIFFRMHSAACLFEMWSFA
uniref:Uncharacterized protein n=1 Tax=Ciona intestinalis TaxID=7719 RepID=H2XW37_CIOIN